MNKRHVIVRRGRGCGCCVWQLALTLRRRMGSITLSPRTALGAS
jgi:hypothetical protein